MGKSFNDFEDPHDSEEYILDETGSFALQSDSESSRHSNFEEVHDQHDDNYRRKILISTNDLSGNTPLEKTVRMTKFDSSNPHLEKFKIYLMSAAENRNNEIASAITNEVGRFVRCFTPKFSWNILLSRGNILDYDTLVRNIGVGADGRLLKLQRICTALKYMRNLKIEKLGDIKAKNVVTIIDEILKSSSTWKTNINRERVKLRQYRLQRMCNEKSTISDIDKILKNKNMWSLYDRYIMKIHGRVKRKERLRTDEVNYVLGVLGMNILFKNCQRPAAFIEMRYDEYARGSQTKDKYVVNVFQHKTGATRSAKLVLDTTLYNRVNDYLSFVRPHISPWKGFEDHLFLSLSGKKVNFYSVLSCVEIKLKIPIFTATKVRKLLTTKAASVCRDQDYRLVNKQMSHSTEVAKTYYEFAHGDDEALQAFGIFKTLRSGKLRDVKVRDDEDSSSSSSSSSEVVYKDDDHEDNLSSEIENESIMPPVEILVKSPKERHRWTKEEVEELKSIFFNDYIKESITPSLSICDQLYPKYHNKNVQDKIRHLIVSYKY